LDSKISSEIHRVFEHLALCLVFIVFLFCVLTAVIFFPESFQGPMSTGIIIFTALLLLAVGYQGFQLFWHFLAFSETYNGVSKNAPVEGEAVRPTDEST